MQPDVVGSLTLQLPEPLGPGSASAPPSPDGPLTAWLRPAISSARSACFLRAAIVATCLRCSRISFSTAALARAARSWVSPSRRSSRSSLAATDCNAAARSRKPSGESAFSSAVIAPSRPVRYAAPASSPSASPRVTSSASVFVTSAARVFWRFTEVSSLARASRKPRLAASSCSRSSAVPPSSSGAFTAAEATDGRRRRRGEAEHEEGAAEEGGEQRGAMSCHVGHGHSPSVSRRPG